MVVKNISNPNIAAANNLDNKTKIKQASPQLEASRISFDKALRKNQPKAIAEMAAQINIAAQKEPYRNHYDKLNNSKSHNGTNNAYEDISRRIEKDFTAHMANMFVLDDDEDAVGGSGERMFRSEFFKGIMEAGNNEFGKIGEVIKYDLNKGRIIDVRN